MRDNGYAILTWLVFIRKKVTALHRLDAGNVKEVRRYEEALDSLRHVAAGEISAPPSLQRELIERVVLRAPIEIIRKGNFVVDNATTRVLVPDCHDSILIGDRQGLKQQVVDGAEDGTICADSESESYDRNRRKSGTPEQVS